MNDIEFYKAMKIEREKSLGHALSAEEELELKEAISILTRMGGLTIKDEVLKLMLKEKELPPV